MKETQKKPHSEELLSESETFIAIFWLEKYLFLYLSAACDYIA
jgi:hypothetical protein